MALYRSYAQLIQFLEEEAMITVEIMLAPKFNMALLYDLLVPIADTPHMGMPLPQAQWDRLVETARTRNKPPPAAPTLPADPNVAAALPPGKLKQDDLRITHAALKDGVELINPPPGFVGMNDRGARQSMSMARYVDPRWKTKLGSFVDKRKELWDAMSVDAQAMFSADMDPIDVTALPVLCQKAFVNVYEAHCGPLHLLWLQMWIFEKTDTCVTRYSIHQSIKTGEDRLDKVQQGQDDTKEPRKRGRDPSPR